MSTRTGETRAVQIAQLLATGTLTHEQIANNLNCSAKTVQRVAKRIKPALQEMEAKVAEYQKQFSKHLPLSRRVELYVKAAEKIETNPFASLRALERIDLLDGIDLRPQKEAEREKEFRPIFRVAGDVVVDMTGRGHSTEKVIDTQPEKISDENK